MKSQCKTCKHGTCQEAGKDNGHMDGVKNICTSDPREVKKRAEKIKKDVEDMFNRDYIGI